MTGDGIAQRAGHAVEDGGLEEEVADGFGLTLQDLFDEIVHDVPVVARERPDETGNVLVALHRERGQLQTGDLAFGAALQRGDVRRRECQPHRLGQESGRLVGGEPQIGRPEFRQFAASAEAGEGQGRVGAAGDD